jgi:hypothetical protein
MRHMSLFSHPRCYLTSPLWVLVLTTLPLAPQQVAAVTVNIAAGAPRISLRVGAAGGAISLVTFTLTATTAGNGAAINGAPNIRIIAEARAVAANTRTATLTVNSTTAMTSVPNSIPMTELSWTTNDVALPAGTFSGGPGQSLTSFMNSRRRTTMHTFRYANTQIYPSGTYNGQVTYTLAMP